MNYIDLEKFSTLENPSINLQINKLIKSYPNGIKAMDNISLEIERGMFGLLGPNGAGKSTLMRTLATLQLPDEGSILFKGLNVLENPLELRKQLGYLPQEFGVYPKQSANTLLDYFALLKGISSKIDRKSIVEDVLELTNLTEVQHKNVSDYSGGMKQRFGIAQLLLNKPKLIIVDEPTSGLDPEERHRFLNVLRAIGNKQIVLFSTHIVEDVSDLCSRFAILNKGKVLLSATPKEAIEKMNTQIWTKTISTTEESIYKKKYSVLSSHFSENENLVIRVHSTKQPDNSFKSSTPNLQDVYFHSLNQVS